jgi:hypothetical protein
VEELLPVQELWGKDMQVVPDIITAGPEEAVVVLAVLVMLL